MAKFKTATGISTEENGINIKISSNFTDSLGAEQTVSAQLTFDYQNKVVQLRPVGMNWVNQNDYVATVDTVAQIIAQAAVMSEAIKQVESALPNSDSSAISLDVKNAE